MILRTITFWLSLVMIFMIPWESGAVVDQFGSLARMIGLLVGGLWLGTVLATGQIRKWKPFHLLLLLFLFWNVISLLWTVSVSATMDRIQTYVQLVVMVFLIWDLFTTPEALKLGLQAYILGSGVSLWGILSNYFNDLAVHGGRYTAFGFNVNGIATIFLLGIPVAWYLAVTSDAKGSKIHGILRVVNFAYVPLAIFAIVLTASRTALFGVVPAIWFMLGSLTRLKPVSRVLVAIAFFGVLFFLQPLVPQTSIDRLSSTSDEISEGDLNGRRQIWDEGIEAFLGNPVFGVGSGAFKSAIPLHRVAHNTYLSILTELGVVGFVLFITILLVALYHIRYQPRWMATLWLAVFLSWAVSITAKTWEYRKPTWLFLNLIVVGAGLIQQTGKSKLPMSVSKPLLGKKQPLEQAPSEG